MNRSRDLRRPLRVALDAHVVGRRQTGNERYTVGIGNALAARDDVDLVALVDEGVDWPIGDGRRAPTIKQLRMRWPQLRIPIELPLVTRRLRADLLQVNYVAPLVSGIPVVTVVHDLSFEDLPGQYQLSTRLRLKAFVRLAVRRSAAVICVSKFTRDRVIAVYGAQPDRVHHVPEGVDSRWRRLPDDETRARLTALALPTRFVLAAGTNHPRKNLPRLVRAMAEVRARGQDVALVLCGPKGSGSGAVDAAIAAVDGDSWVRRLGYVDDAVLHALYCAADVVAYPSVYEGFGLPVLEALACGAVLVAGSRTSIPEVAGDAALLVDSTDTDSLRDGLLKALTDEGLRSRLREAGPVQASRFSWVDAASQTVEVYRAVLETQQRRARS